MVSTPPFQDSDITRSRELPDEQHPALRYLAQLGPGSRRTMTEALAKLARLASDGRCDARSLPWHRLTREQTSALRTELASSLAPATTNKHLAALRGVLKHANQLGLMHTDAYQRAIDLPTVHGPAPRKGRSLSNEELALLVETCERDASPAGARDAALLSLLFGAGLRRSEVVAIQLDDYDPESGMLTVRATGSRSPRRYQIDRRGRQKLEGWLGRRSLIPGPLFNPVNKGGRLEVRGLSEQAIYIACRKRSNEAGIPPVSPEDLRRSLRESPAQAARRVSPGGAIVAA